MGASLAGLSPELVASEAASGQTALTFPLALELMSLNVAVLCQQNSCSCLECQRFCVVSASSGIVEIPCSLFFILVKEWPKAAVTEIPLPKEGLKQVIGLYILHLTVQSQTASPRQAVLSYKINHEFKFLLSSCFSNPCGVSCLHKFQSGLPALQLPSSPKKGGKRKSR